jgi:autotransporter-associated beta strand protein
MKFFSLSTASLLLAATALAQDPTNVFTWAGAGPVDNKYWSVGANWKGNVAPKPLSSNICVFKGDLGVPTNWPYIDANYGTTILIFSNNIILNGIKILAGKDHTMNLGSYVLQLQAADAQSPSYFGIDSPIEISFGGTRYWVTNANFTNALGDASCGSQTDFRCLSNRLDVYGVLKDGAGTSSKLVKSGSRTLNITGMKANLYTGGTLINDGPVKLQKPAGINAIPGDVTANGTGGLIINVLGGEQIANTSVITFNDSAYFDMIGQPETVRTIQSTSANARIINVDSTLTVAPLSSGTYNGGVGESDFAGSISGSGTVRMNGTGTYGMLGANSVANLTVNSGTLKVNGNSGTGAVTINSGGTLLGQGTIAGAVTVASGGTIGAGFSPGLLTLPAGLNQSAGGNGATNVWELAALQDNATGLAGADFDQIVVTGGNLALGTQATLDIRFTGSATAPDAGDPFWQSVHTWTVVSLSGGLNPGASNFGRVKNGSYAAGDFTTSVNGSGGIVLTFMPSTPPTTVPAAPVASAATGVTSNGFTANWSYVSQATGYRLDVSTNSGFADFVSGYQDLDVGYIVSWNVGALTAETTYYYRVRAYNLNGASTNSDTINVTTAVAVNPPSAPIANAATSVTTSNFTANWSGVGGATGYRLDVSTNNAFSNFLGVYQDLDVGNVNTQSVNGLSAGATCYYRVRACNAAGPSGNSGTIAVTLSLASGCTPVSLVNGDFDGGTNANGVGIGWTGYQRAPNPTTTWIVKTASPPPVGSANFQQIANTSSTGGGGVRQDVTGCTVGATYQISGWMRGNSELNSTCTVKCSPTASSDWSTANDLTPPQTYTGSVWQPFSGTVVATGTSMTLWLDGQTGSTGLNKAECFDSVTVTCLGAPLPFRFDSVNWQSPNQVQLSLTGIPGSSVTIQSSSNLVNWVTLTNLTNVSGTFEFTDTPPPGVPQRFYRATSP